MKILHTDSSVAETLKLSEANFPVYNGRAGSQGLGEICGTEEIAPRLFAGRRTRSRDGRKKQHVVSDRNSEYDSR